MLVCLFVCLLVCLFACFLVCLFACCSQLLAVDDQSARRAAHRAVQRQAPELVKARPPLRLRLLIAVGEQRAARVNMRAESLHCGRSAVCVRVRVRVCFCVCVCVCVECVRACVAHAFACAVPSAAHRMATGAAARQVVRRSDCAGEGRCAARAAAAAPLGRVGVGRGERRRARVRPGRARRFVVARRDGAESAAARAARTRNASRTVAASFLAEWPPPTRAPLPHAAAPGLGSPLPHAAASGLGSPLPHLHRDWAHPCHICAGTAAHDRALSEPVALRCSAVGGGGGVCPQAEAEAAALVGAELNALDSAIASLTGRTPPPPSSPRAKVHARTHLLPQKCACASI